MANNAYLGIDVSKGYADFITLQSDKEVLERAFRLYDVAEGHEQLSKLLDQWLVKGIDTVYCGVESTGGYENNWVNYLLDLGKTKPVHIARLNPKGVKALGEAGLTRTITDSVSANNIGLYLIDYKRKINYLSPESSAKVYSEGRRHNSFIRMLKKQKNQLENQLEKIVYQDFSSLMCYCRHGFPRWILLLMEKYPSVELIKKAGQGKLCKIKGITKDKAVALLKKISSDNKATSGHTSTVVKSTVEQILHLEKAIADQKADLINRFKNLGNTVLLTSITGIGVQSAVDLLLEIEDVNRFENAKKIVAYFGTHPMWKQSGDGTWGNHMSKKGRSEIRGVLYMCCITAVRHDEMFKKIYAGARSQGKNHYSAMGVVMNKMLRVIYGVLKNQTRYNKEVDYKNRENAKTRQKQKEEEQIETKKEKQTKLERFNQEPIDNTPVSRRYAKKKRQSPKLQKEECTGSSAP